jgi:hypothetical protein
LAAVGIDSTADEVEIVGVFVAGDTAKFVTFSSDIAVGVVAECASGAAGQGDLGQAVEGIPLLMSNGAHLCEVILRLHITHFDAGIIYFLNILFRVEIGRGAA